MRILVTGAGGFIGSNLVSRLKRLEGVETDCFDLDNSEEELSCFLSRADLVYHLAGVNRPRDRQEFYSGNYDLTERIVTRLAEGNKKPPVVFSSSIQAGQDNDYGISKRMAENALVQYIQRGGTAYIYRLDNVFGKWCRPNYNSVVATFCNNIANGLPIEIHDDNRIVTLNYIDDVIDEFMGYIGEPRNEIRVFSNPLSLKERYSITLKGLADRIREFSLIGESCLIPDLSDQFGRKLYATYLSYLPSEKRKVSADIKADDRGILFELIKSHHAGQIFISKTKPGVTRGNHYHHTKTEKFCVISGRAMIRMRRIDSDVVQEYSVNGDGIEIIDIPPGYTHNITNTGSEDLITVFWANEIFNRDKTDTYYEEV